MLRLDETQVTSLGKDKSGLMTYSRYRHLATERARPVLTNARLEAGSEPLRGTCLLASFQDFLHLSPVLKIRMRS